MFEEQVQCGAKWLDQMAPGWDERIDIRTLNLSNYDNCSLGQIFGELASRNICANRDFSISHGFALTFKSVEETVRGFFGETKLMVKVQIGHPLYEQSYAKLSGQWVMEILRRRSLKTMQKEAITKIQQEAVK